MIQKLQLLAWLIVRSFRIRRTAHILTALALILGVALTLLVPLMLNAFQRSALDAANIFDLLITAKGGQTQAVLSTIYYQEAPIGNLPYSVYQSLAQDERSLRVIPFGFGDNYQGYPIVGTTSAFFDLKPSAKAAPYFVLAQGQLFRQEDEVVIGARVAQTLSLNLGERFSPTHGFELELEAAKHNHEYEVVGILKATGGPSDRAIYGDIAAIWEAHGQYSLDELNKIPEFSDLLTRADLQVAGDTREISAILFAAKNLGDLYTIANQINQQGSLQAVFPGLVLGRLINFLGSGRQAYSFLAVLVLILAMISIALSAFATALYARRNLALLRIVGVPRYLSVSSFLLEALLLSLVSIGLGIALAYLAMFLIGQLTFAQAGLRLVAPRLRFADLNLIVWLIPVSLFFAFLPIARAMRQSPLKQLGEMQ